VRCSNDTAYAVRTAAIHVWKSVVVNTPKTLRAIMARLLALAIEAVGGEGEERQAMASRCLGELVAKMGSQARVWCCCGCLLHCRLPQLAAEHRLICVATMCADCVPHNAKAC
jgi:hypothetical protein